VRRDNVGKGTTTFPFLRGIIIIRERQAGHIGHGCGMADRGTSTWDGGGGRIIARRGRILVEDGQGRHAFGVTEVLHVVLIDVVCCDDLCSAADGLIDVLILGTFRIIVARGSCSSLDLRLSESGVRNRRA